MTRTRITRRDLEAIISGINKWAGTPEDPREIGAYHLSGPYEGWALHQTMTDSQAIRNVFGGYIPARELFAQMWAYRMGLMEIKG